MARDIERRTFLRTVAAATAGIVAGALGNSTPAAAAPIATESLDLLGPCARLNGTRFAGRCPVAALRARGGTDRMLAADGACDVCGAALALATDGDGVTPVADPSPTLVTPRIVSFPAPDDER